MNAQQKKIHRGTQEKLEEELKRLKVKIGLAVHLRVVWSSKAHSNLSGEVKRNDLIIYEESLDKTLSILRHEFLDYCISQVIESYKEVTNKLIRMINDDAYRRKKKIVEALTRLIEEKE
jgi:hypothetical protein